MDQTTITDIKLVYPEFKEFKNIYTSVNSATEIVLLGADTGIDLIFSRDDACYIFYGHWEVETLLAKWLREDNKIVTMKMETFKALQGTLKKDVISCEYNDVHFRFTFKIKGTEDTKDIILFDCRGSSTIDTILSNIKLKRGLLKYDYSVSKDLLQDELLKLFIEKGKVTTERKNDKLIEVPIARLVCYLKNGTTTLRYSDKIHGQRFVEITSEDPKLKLRLRQLFLTI